MAHLLGIDLGSTSIKAVAYDLAGNIAASHSVPAEIKYLDSDHPTWAFWDPDTVWESTITVIKSVLDQTGNAADIEGIAPPVIEQQQPIPQFRIELNHDMLAHYGITAQFANHFIETAIHGQEVSKMIERTCRSCVHFDDDPGRLEAEFPYLTVFGSAPLTCFMTIPIIGPAACPFPSFPSAAASGRAATAA